MWFYTNQAVQIVSISSENFLHSHDILQPNVFKVYKLIEIRTRFHMSILLRFYLLKTFVNCKPSKNKYEF